jgi:two-component system phosphate regulon response regulator PhoB
MPIGQPARPLGAWQRVIVVSRIPRTIIAMSDSESSRKRPHSTGSLRTGAPKTALLVVEEPCVRDLIATSLRAIGWFAVVASTSQEGWRLASQVLPDVVVMDLDSPATANDDWLRDLARSGESDKRVLTVVLSSQTHLNGENIEAHDAVDLWAAKPLDAGDLITRIVRLLRSGRGRLRTPPAIRFASVELDRHQPTIRVRRTGDWLTLDLARTEHRLLEFLLADPARVHSRQSIRNAIWPGAGVELRTVDQYVHRLRRSLGCVDANNLIGTVAGAGYRLRLDLFDHATS